MNLKLLVILLFSIIIVSPVSVFAFEDIFDGYVYSMDTFKVEDDIYYAQITKGEDIILLHKNEELYYVNNGTCEDNAYYRFCFNGTKLDYQDYGRPIPNSMSWEPAIHVIIYSKIPDIKVSRSHSAEINRDEQVKVSVTVENEGQLNIFDLEYEEIIPDTATIYSLGENVRVRGNKIMWSGPILTPGNSNKFTYTLKSSNFETINLKEGNLSFVYEDLDYTIKPASTNIKINSPVSIETTVSKDDLGLEEEFTYNFKVTNEDWEDRMDVTLNLQIPDAIKLDSITTLVPKSNNINYEFSLDPGESKTIKATMKPLKEGVHKIKSNVDVNIRNENINKNITFNITVDIPKLIPTLKLSKETVYEGNTFSVVVNMENPAEIYFYELSGTLHGTIIDTHKLSLSNIAPGDKVELFQDNIQAPSVDKDTTYGVTFVGRYRTSTFESFTFEEKKTIVVKPVSIGFDIIKSVSKSEVYPNEEVTVTVKAKNIGQRISVVSLNEEIPETLEFVSGLTKKALTLDINQEQEFYIYRVRIPKDAEPGVYVVKTTLDYENSLNIVEEAKITVKKNETEDGSSGTGTIGGTDTEEKEKKGFFRSIIDFFKNFFK
ncbi:MAG: hypothetical protein ABH828_01535 [archaeon]